ncbi:MAG: endonuclease MutS2 [bacterium]|jgi:DNA mismatch repair protein MutS2
MDQHTLSVLEFQKVKENLRTFCISPLGAEVVDELQPFTDITTIHEELAEVTEMVRLWHARQEPPLEGIYDIRPALRLCEVPAAVLDPEQIILIRDIAIAARKVHNSKKYINTTAPRILEYCHRIIPLPQLENSINQVFDDQTQIRDTASRELARVREALRSYRQSIVSRLERLIRGSWSDYLQEPLYTQREGRYVLPVDSRFQNRVKGIIHGRSSTHTTVYMEPMELVDEGNRLKEFQREEDIEVRRILRDLTALISQHLEELNTNVQIFQRLDFIAAKARFSMRYEMNEPGVNDQGILTMYDARHPLLLIQKGKDHVVPLNLDLPQTIHGLIVTGPNTGGKTVILKTVGLMVLMAQSGMHIPAGPRTEIPVYQYIGADIGDEQSLEQNLSTFSSHMNNIRRILENARSNSLVLLDELGSGTDPVEGGALSCAILEQLSHQGATFMVTTHLQELKLYAHNTEGVENGAMEFDLQNLQPTFRFSMGLPGQSNAIQIANRLGLPKPVIQRAKESITKREESPDEMLTKLGEELRLARAQREESDEVLNQAQQLKEESARRIENARREAQEIIQRAERKAENLVNEFDRKVKDLEQKEKAFKQQWQERLNLLLEQSKNIASPLEQISDPRPRLEKRKKLLRPQKPRPEKKMIEKPNWTWDQLKPGTFVRIQGIPGDGRIVNAQEKRSEVEVNINNMTMRVKSDRIQSILQPRPEKSAQKVQADYRVDRPDKAVHVSLDIHGMTVEEMTPVVEKYLDEAFRSGLPWVRIVHGFGQGILRRSVRSLLKSHPLVHQFTSGGDHEGGEGVTIAKFRGS